LHVLRQSYQLWFKEERAWLGVFPIRGNPMDGRN